MLKRNTVLIFILLILISSFTVVFADEVSSDNSDVMLIASADSDNEEPQVLEPDDEREFTTSRKYSFQIFVGLLVCIVIYRVYKFIKYKR